MKIHLDDLDVGVVEDRPLRGQWHCGPNPSWITVTHLPTLTSVRVYTGRRMSQHKVREFAQALIELALEEFGDEPCSFPERILTQPKTRVDSRAEPVRFNRSAKEDSNGPDRT